METRKVLRVSEIICKLLKAAEKGMKGSEGLCEEI